jgi:carbon monoxide dehydrogenase subunit G
VKLHQEFMVAEPVGTVWKFFEEPEAVARCMPGVEKVTVLDPDNVQVRATQSVGPMTATFDAKVTVLERVTDELIRFRSTGKSVRGAVGNLRTENTVRLRGSAEGTTVAVDGDVVLAGALGSVGQKVVARQADKVTAEFAANLRRALNGELPSPPEARAGTGAVSGDRAIVTPVSASSDRWSRVATALSGASLVVGVLILIRQRKGAR